MFSQTLSARGILALEVENIKGNSPPNNQCGVLEQKKKNHLKLYMAWDKGL